jgi:hypothetical protein
MLVKWLHDNWQRWKATSKMHTTAQRIINVELLAELKSTLK